MSNSIRDCWIDTKDITAEQIETIEKEVNAKIRQALPVTVDVVELDDPKLTHVCTSEFIENPVCFCYQIFAFLKLFTFPNFLRPEEEIYPRMSKVKFAL